MPWFKVDDSFHSHPKAMCASLAALGLWSVAGSWSGDHLTDGFVPDYMLPSLSRGQVELADELVAAGLWRRTKGGYRFHQWASDANGTRRNFTAEEVADRRAKRADAGRKGGKQKAANASDQQEQGQQMPSDGVASARPVAKQTPSTDPKSPGALKEKDPLRGSEKKAARQARGTRLPEDFTITEEMRDYARRKAPHVDIDAETEHFTDYWQAKAGHGARKVDWQATWRTWMRRAEERRPPSGTNGKPSKDDKLRALQTLKTTPLHSIEGGAS